MLQEEKDATEQSLQHNQRTLENRLDEMTTHQHSSGVAWQAKANGLEEMIRSNESQFYKVCREQSDIVANRTRELSVTASDDRFGPHSLFVKGVLPFVMYNIG